MKLMRRRCGSWLENDTLELWGLLFIVLASFVLYGAATAYATLSKSLDTHGVVASGNATFWHVRRRLRSQDTPQPPPSRAGEGPTILS
mmetsp:Transcript_8724/g.28543  ORF Transcript_8724/g.28543 Transcript_8724/m.28543 type:complete len:88 (-) Transcript_8724:42-305(-)